FTVSILYDSLPFTVKMFQV
ncbi:hypothetical protein K1719_047564, partial [Acacia pycnantha]